MDQGGVGYIWARETREVERLLMVDRGRNAEGRCNDWGFSRMRENLLKNIICIVSHNKLEL